MRNPRIANGLRSLAALLVSLFLGTLHSASRLEAQAPGETPANFKVAFIGDQGINANAQALLQLILDEGAHMVLHQGDLGYNETDPNAHVNWYNQMTAILGESFPYFVSIGNHDVSQWDDAVDPNFGYRPRLEQQLANVPGANCVGDYGERASCTYQGLFFILSGVGTTTPANDPDQIAFIRDELAQDDSIWRICSWHKNQNAMQVGGKTNEVGWGPYEECRQGDAIIATGHEHSYSRTKTLTSTENQTVDPAWPDRNTLRVGQGSTFVFVSGIAGQSIRNQDRCKPTTYPYGCNGEWAMIYTSDQGAQVGALFIEFHVNGDPRMARGYFKNISGQVVDQFTLFADLPDPPTGAISGTVTDSLTGVAIEGASVTTDTGESTSTDDGGQYVLGSVPVGDRTVTVSASGYLSQQQAVQVAEGVDTVADFVLDPESNTGAIQGGVIDATTGRKISGANVLVDTGETGKTNGGGKYTVSDVPIGVRTVTVSKTGYVSQQSAVNVPPGGTVRVDFALDPESGGGGEEAGTIKGIVIDANTGRKLSGVMVAADTGQSTMTNGGGRYALGQVPPGDRTVTASKSGYATQPKQVNLLAGQTVDLSFTLVPQ